MSPRLCVVGGKLQGTEASYLAGKAGFSTILIDRKKNSLASTLVDEVAVLDVLKDTAKVRRILSDVDAVLLAIEDLAVMDALEELCSDIGVHYLQDNSAFKVTSKKDGFTRFCDENGMKYPPIFPESKFPVIVKPVSGSGSRGVQMARDEDALKKLVPTLDKDSGYLIQEYASGYFLSLELLGFEGEPSPMQVTCLEFDESYGCKRVIAPCPLGDAIAEGNFSLGKKLVKGLKLTGLTDLQTVARGESVEVIEANARLPSQTPTAVYFSTGVNMVKDLFSLFQNGEAPKFQPSREDAVIYQHVQMVDHRLKVVAEHHISEASSLRVEKGFYGLEEAITNFGEESRNLSIATLIARDNTLEKAKEMMEAAIEQISEDYKLAIEPEKSPWGVSNIYDKINH